MNPRKMMMKKKSDVTAAVRGGSHVVFSEDMLHDVSSTLKKESFYIFIYFVFIPCFVLTATY